MKNRVFEAALEIQRFCEERNFRFCVIKISQIMEELEPLVELKGEPQILGRLRKILG